MTEAIIIALITAAAGVITQIVISSRTTNLMAYRLTELEKKVTLHNNLVEHMTKIETKVNTIEEVIQQLEKFHMH